MVREKRNDVPLLLCLYCLFLSLPDIPFAAYAETQADEIVILLHGLGRSERSMDRLERYLSLKKYRVVNARYPSTKFTVEFLADRVLDAVILESQKSSPNRIHFVTHSMGGIILRYYLKHHDLDNLGRVVMLSPPNQGSELVDHLKDTFLFKQLSGPAGKQLGTSKDSLPNRLGPVDFELGVIAGDKSMNFFYSLLIPGPDDGVVAVNRTKVEGMKDFIVVPQSHTFIMNSREVVEQVVYFLENGLFNKEENETYNRESE